MTETQQKATLEDFKPIFNSLEALEEQNDLEKTYDLQFHKHVQGEEGASELVKCTYLKALKGAGFKLPEKSEFKKRDEIFEVGTALHKDIQTKLVRRYKKKGITAEFGAEVYVEKEIVPGLIISTPCDIVYVQPNDEGEAYKIVEKEFANNFRAKVRMIADGATILQVDDIKSMGDYAWDKKEIPFGYLAQFHYEANALNLKGLCMLAIHKDTGAKKYEPVQYNQEIWDEVLAVIKHRLNLTTDYKMYLQNNPEFDYNTLNPVADDLACLKTKHDNIDWWSCNLSQCETYMKTFPVEKESQRLIKPCAAACRKIDELFENRFKVGQIWKRRNDDPAKRAEPIVIDEVDVGLKLVKCHKNVKTKAAMANYEDSAVKAWVSYYPMDEE
jgi:L-rhamnose mutarotase